MSIEEIKVSTHSRLKAAGWLRRCPCQRFGVSTHSRLKAAGRLCKTACQGRCCFNTQPPKGGWRTLSIAASRVQWFQHTAA